MNNFEEYSVKCWLSDGMTSHPSRATSQGARLNRRPWPVKLLVPFVAATAMSILVHAPIAVAMPGTRAPYAGVRMAEEEPLIWGSPALYWSRAIADVRAWRPVAEQDVESPPPLF